MKAIVHHTYGSPDLLEFQDVDKPVAKDDELLVRVHASSVNPADWYRVAGTPYVGRMGGGLRRPKVKAAGLDFAGQVEAIGRKVTGFQPGDEVFGARLGAYAEYLCVRATKVAPKPANVTFEQAAAVPVAALTALQGLRDTGRIRSGQRVLINGASGGVGTFAVQVAKSFGAHVTGVCSTRNVDLVRSIGADEVVNYTRQDFTGDGQRYDLIFDAVGNRSVADRRRALSPTGILVVVGGPKGGRWLGPATALFKVIPATLIGRQKLRAKLSTLVREDLLALRDLLAAGTIVPVIDRRYPLSGVPEALGYLGEGHARGKIVIDVSPA